MLDDMGYLADEGLTVEHEKRCPHILVELGYTGKIAEAPRREACLIHKAGALDVSAGNDVRQLRGKGDDPVMLLRRGHDALSKADVVCELRDLPNGRHGGAVGGSHDKAGLLEQVVHRVAEA